MYFDSSGSTNKDEWSALLPHLSTQLHLYKSPPFSRFRKSIPTLAENQSLSHLKYTYKN